MPEQPAGRERETIVPVRVFATEIGFVRGVVKYRPDTGLTIVIEAPPQRTTSLDLKIINPADGAQICTVGQIRRQYRQLNKPATYIEMAVPPTDTTAVVDLGAWIERARAQSAPPSGVVGVDAGADADAVRGAASPPPDLQSESTRFKADRRMEQARIALQDGRTVDAYRLLQEAVRLSGENTSDLQLQLAHLAEGMGRLDLAEEHAAAAVALAPDKPKPAAVLESVRRRRHENTQTLREIKLRQIRAEERRRALRAWLATAAALLALAVAVGGNLWAFVLPQGPAPRTVASDLMGDTALVVEARVHRETLFVTANADLWAALGSEARRNELRRLNDVATKVGAVRVIVSDDIPRILGIFERGDARLLR